MNTINKWSVTLASLVALTGIATERVQAQTFTTIHTFDYSDGNFPAGALIQATDGDLYGTTYLGGANGYGTVFKITPRESLTTVYNFCEQPDCLDGGDPIGPVIQATDGDFYGVTVNGGANCASNQHCGTVFSLSLHGELTTLYSFCSEVTSTSDCLGGPFLGVGLVQAANGDFYGTTYGGGANDYGSVYKITRAGVLTTEVSFDGTTDGANPEAGLVQATNGFLYGTTNSTVFDITEHGSLTTLIDLNREDGYGPAGALIQATDGNLYGSTQSGGSNGQGTIFKITPAGVITTLYNFCSQPNCADGASPWSALTQGSDGNFYGVTQYGGNGVGGTICYGPGCGTIFKLTPSGDLTTLYSFCSQPTADGFCPDGDSAYGLTQATDGNFYGTTIHGGITSNYGTVYKLSVGLGPFVALQTAFGKVGATVNILGTRLTGVTSVTFNGTPATFTVKASHAAIIATVPTGATTGTVTVATSSGVLSSNRPFTVQE